MPGQETCAPPVIVTFPAQINAATAEQAAGQISAAFTPGVTVVIADLTATACRDCSAIRHLLRAHRCDSRSGPAGRCTGSPNSPAPTRCSRSTPPSSTP
jgi:anti-anti-sigma regulatory factor